MHKTIIIISAFRSGSNLIKDVLCQLPGVGTWPSENISFIWKHGNSFKKDDEFSVAEARKNVKKYMIYLKKITRNPLKT